MQDEPILIACDLGETTPVVLRAGLALCDRLGAPPILVHVDAHAHLFREGFHAVDEEDLRRMKAAYHGKAQTALRRLLADVGRDDAGVETTVGEGRPHEVLLDEIRRQGAQAVVLGARVRAGTERLLLGRTAVRVAREASCGVFTVEVHRPWNGIARVLYASDLQDGGRAERWAARLAGAFGAELVVIHVSHLGSDLAEPYALLPQKRDEMLADLEERLEGLKLHLATEAGAHAPGPSGLRARLFSATDPAPAIVDVGRAENADVIVLGTHGRRGIGRVLMGSVAEWVLAHAGTCVLTARDHE